MINEITADQLETNRPTQVEIELPKITANYNAIKTATDCKKIMCILKANAYGHGLIKIAQHLESLNAAYFGVAYLEEGILLRKAGIKTPILVLGGITGNQIPYFLQYDLTITASSISKLEQIEACAKELNIIAKVHLKVDTGMERIGIHYYSAHKLIAAANTIAHCHIEGIYTHLANADSDQGFYDRLQIKRFKRVLQYYDKNNIDKPMIHVGNSAGALKYPDIQYDMVRIGLLLYGVYPTREILKIITVSPALSWKTRVVYFKVVQPNHPVSYGSTWESKKMTRVVTLPVGYGDGYMRAMSNKAHVLIRGVKYQNVGTICMDQMMVNINWDTAYNGDEVTLIGTDGENSVTVEDLAEWANTIPYEILTNINTRVPRVYK